MAAANPPGRRAAVGGGVVSRTLRIADLFCGAGGTSTGAVQAAEARRKAKDLLEEAAEIEALPVG